MSRWFLTCPLGWEHINLSGYIWRNNLKLGSGKYRPLRTVDVSLYKNRLSVGYFPFSADPGTVEHTLYAGSPELIRSNGEERG
jgi:hypothetical protein